MLVAASVCGRCPPLALGVGGITRRHMHRSLYPAASLGAPLQTSPAMRALVLTEMAFLTQRHQGFLEETEKLALELQGIPDDELSGAHRSRAAEEARAYANFVKERLRVPRFLSNLTTSTAFAGMSGVDLGLDNTVSVNTMVTSSMRAPRKCGCLRWSFPMKQT